MTTSFNCDRDALNASLTRLKRIVQTRCCVPILKHLHIEADVDSIIISATDMDVMLRERITANVASPGNMTLPAKALHDLVSKAPKGCRVAIVLTEPAKATVMAGPIVARMESLVPADFPLHLREAPECEPIAFNLPAQTWRRIVATVGHAITSKETPRYYLNGINLEAKSGVLSAVTTDGHRLARLDVDLPVGAYRLPSIIVPHGFVTKLTGSIGKKDSGDLAVAVWPTDGLMTVHHGPSSWSAKLIDGTFPEYERVVPRRDDTPKCGTWTVAAADALAVVGPLAKMAAKGEAKIKLSFNGGIDLSARTGEWAEDRTNVPGPGDWNGVVGTEIGFNGRYLADTLEAITGAAEFRVFDPTFPVLVLDAGEPRATFVIMPMHL